MKYVTICICGQRNEVNIEGIRNVHSSLIKGNCIKCGKIINMSLGK